MTHDEALAAWASFTGKKIKNQHLDEFFSTVFAWEDITAKILLESDFLVKYPDVENILRSHVPTNSKCLLDVDFKYLKRANKERFEESVRSLNSMQIEYCKKSADLVELECRILDARRALNDL